MNKEKVSIIIPIYNAEKNIKRCLESVLNQTYKNYEVICVDDGSTDNSKIIIEEFCRRYKNVNYIYQKNSGVSSARNRGIQIAKGEYIVFIDSDDYIKEEMIEILVYNLIQNNSDIVFCNFFKENDNFKILNKPLRTKQMSKKTFEKNFLKYYKNSLINQPWNKIYIKDKIINLFDINKNLGEDLEFNILYLINVKNIMFVNEYLYYYDMSSTESLSKKYYNYDYDYFEIYNIIYKNINLNFTSVLRLDLFIVKGYAKNIFYLKKDFYKAIQFMNKFYDNMKEKNILRSMIYSKVVLKIFFYLFQVREKLLKSNK